MNELTDISWVGVFVGAVVASLLGWVWFHGKVFGTKWAEGSRIELSSAPSPFSMVTQFVAFVLMSMVVGITAQLDMLITAIISILAVAVMVLSIGSFVKKTPYAMIVDFFYMVTAGVIMIVSQAIF